MRLTSSLMGWMVAVAYLLLRKYGGPGSDKLAAGLALFGMANVPFIYISVNYWRTIHPTTNVVPTLPTSMGVPLWFSAVDVPAAVRPAAADARPARRAAGEARRAVSLRGCVVDERVCRNSSLVLVADRSGPRRCPAATWLTPQPPPQQQEEFVPIDELPPQDQLPAAPLLVAAYSFVVLALFAYVVSVARRLGARAAGARAARVGAEAQRADLMPTAAHFLYIPAVLILGIVIGWILGSRAAADAYAAQLRKNATNRRARSPQARR